MVACPVVIALYLRLNILKLKFRGIPEPITESTREDACNIQIMDGTVAQKVVLGLNIRPIGFFSNKILRPPMIPIFMLYDGKILYK